MMKLRVERAIVKFLEEYEEDVDLDGIKQGIVFFSINNW